MVTVVNFLLDVFGYVIPELRELDVEEKVASCFHIQKASRQHLRKGDIVSRASTVFGTM